MSGNSAAGAGDAGMALRCVQERMAIDLADVTVAGRGVDAASTRHQPATRAMIDAGNAARLELAWAFGLPGVTEARSQPVITADTVFVLTVPGRVFALDRDTGCIEWQYRAPAPLRTALSLGVAGDRSVLYFGDLRAHVTALDAATGEPIWRQGVGLFETSALLALDASTGTVRWTSPMTPPARPTGHNAVVLEQWGPSGATVWSAPTVDAVRGLVYVGTGQNLSARAGPRFRLRSVADSRFDVGRQAAAARRSEIRRGSCARSGHGRTGLADPPRRGLGTRRHPLGHGGRGSAHPWPDCPLAYGYSAAPMSANDMVFVQSGYGSFGQMPGNALPAFRLAAAR